MRLLPAALAAVLSSGALAQAPTVQPTVQTREIGPWLLACTADPITDRTDCTLRHRLWIVPPEGGEGQGIALEIVLRDGRALPAVTARALTLADTTRGALAFAATAELRLDQGRALDLACSLEGRDAVCLPTAEAARAEAALPDARRALVRLRTAARIAGGGDVHALELARTAEAITALKERGPGAPPPPSPARSFLDELERLIRGR